MIHLNEAKPAVTLPATPEEKALLRSFFLLSAKPTIFACNVGESDLAGINEDNSSSPAAKHVKAVSSYVATHLSTEAVVISAQIESELADLSSSEAAEYLAGLGVKESGTGVTHGRAGLFEFVRMKHVNWDLLPMKSNWWWFPYTDRWYGRFKALMKVLYRWGLRKIA